MKKKILISMILTLILLCNIKVYATDTATLPSKYDLRNDINIKVEDQGQRSWCNVYSYVKMIETYLQRTRGTNYNLSESYVAYSNAKYFGGEDEKLTNPTIINNSSVDISNIIDKNSLVLESEFPNKDYVFNKANKEKFDNATVMIKSFRPTSFLKSEEIKQYISTKGAIQIQAYGKDSKAKSQWQNSNGTINCKINEDNSESGHAVVIIGWDDNYSRNNFNSSNRPKNNGAWLILNSWGTDWGNNGTAWVSYEDEWFNWSIQNFEAKGINDITLRGEINANFSYEYNKLGQIVTAKIEADDRIENIEGWTYYSDYIYTKRLTDSFEPYNITVKSKIDGATTTVNVNIPDEVFTKAKQEKEEQQAISEQRDKEIEEQKQINDKRDSFVNVLDIIIYIAIGLFIIAIIVLYCLSKDKTKQNINNVFRKLGKFLKAFLIAILILAGIVGIVAVIILIL